MECCRRAWVVFQQVWSEETELLMRKQRELTNLLSGKADSIQKRYKPLQTMETVGYTADFQLLIKALRCVFSTKHKFFY